MAIVTYLNRVTGVVLYLDAAHRVEVCFARISEMVSGEAGRICLYICYMMWFLAKYISREQGDSLHVNRSYWIAIQTHDQGSVISASCLSTISEVAVER